MCAPPGPFICGYIPYLSYPSNMWKQKVWEAQMPLDVQEIYQFNCKISATVNIVKALERSKNLRT